MIKAHEPESIEAVKTIKSIIGNSKSTKLLPHLLVIAASQASKNQQYEATQQIEAAWEVIDNIKIDL